MRKILPFLLLVCLLLSISGLSQELKGRVLNESGERTSGVSVQFQNKSNAITTRPDGSFKIMATKLPDTLVFSAPGYEPYKVVITEKNIKDPDFEVVLLNTRVSMDEVVVRGFAATKKRDVTGSVATVSREELSGKVAGVTIAADESARSRGTASPGKEYYKASPESRSYAPISPVDGKLYLADTNIAPRTGMAAKSRILTAGEVNDFNKWKMWEEYSENEFRAMGIFWGVKPVNRYSVQLTDKKFRALVNEPVYLVSKLSGDTVWKAMTDNTGKAELWGGFLRNEKEGETYYITDRSGNKLQSPSAFANGVNLLTADRGCGLSPDVDIAFVVDATGSMGDEIEFLKLELEDVIRHTMEKYKSLTLRAAPVFYRDNGDAYVTRHAGFNDDLLKTLNFIKLQSAGGGGDTPEAVDQAMSTAIDSLQWNPEARTRILFLILDAPPHNEGKERIRQLTLKAAAKGIRIVPIACSGTDKSTEFLLRSIALATNGTYTFLTNHSGVGNTHIEPTTDKYAVELLGNLMERIIGQYVDAKDCGADEKNMVQVPVRVPENILTVKLYPNPTSGNFIIESNKEIKEIYIADFTGKLLMKLGAADKKGKWQVNIGMYPSGTYLIKYITADNKWGAEKLVLMRGV